MKTKKIGVILTTVIVASSVMVGCNTSTATSSGGDADVSVGQKKEDIEIIKYDITIAGENGNDIYLEYDPKLKEYSWF